jgi:tetratricopeptide (TPR) repeat protein
MPLSLCRIVAGGCAGLICLISLALPSFAQAQAKTKTPRKGSRPAGETIESHLGKGYEALKQDSYAVAAVEFRAALRIDPRLTLRARFPLAVALFELHQPAAARKELEAVRREVGDHPNILYYLGRLDLEERKFAGAVADLSQAAAKPPFPDTAYYLGFAYFQQGNFPEAEKWLKSATEATPQDARVPYQLAQVYRKEGHEDEARDALRRSEEVRERGNATSLLRMDCAQKLDQGPREEARAFCDQMYDPNDAAKLTALGTIYGQHGDLEAALKPLQRAAELEPESPQSQYNVALTYYQMNRLEDALAPLAKAVEHWPDLFQLSALYGAVLAKSGEDRAAYQALRHAHQLNLQDKGTEDLLFLTTLGLGRRSQSAKEYPDALRYFEEAAKLRPQEASPHAGMADIFKLTGRAAQAAREQSTAELLKKRTGN